MKLITINNNSMGQNVYLYYDEETKEGVIIDSGDNAADVSEIVKRDNIRVKALLLTHGHYDHIMGAVKLAALYSIHCHELEKPMLKEPQLNLSGMTGSDIKITPDKLLKDGDILDFTNFSLKVIHTPGHTPGGVCYYDEKNAMLFTGDTLFREAIGRSDFPGGSYSELVTNIKQKLLTLPDDVKVLPGHETSSTIGFEKGNNPYLA